MNGPLRWRTVLFTPGTRPERVEKAWRGAAADVVILDLEDAVPPEGKGAARAAAADLLGAVPDAACARGVRINTGPTGEADLDAVLAALPDVLVVPKAEDAAALTRLCDHVEREGGATLVLAIVETARGVLEAPDLCRSGIHAVAFGAEDLAADAGLRRTAGNAEVAVPRSLVALAAAAAGIPAIDMITADYQDTKRTRSEAQEARGLGYAGKMCLHPDQVAVVREAFAPTADETAWARRVVAAADAAGADAGGVVVVDGRMVDAPLVRQARRILSD